MVWDTDAEHSHDMPWLSRKVPTPTSEASKLFLRYPCAPKASVISHDKYCISSEMQPSTPGEKKEQTVTRLGRKGEKQTNLLVATSNFWQHC